MVENKEVMYIAGGDSLDEAFLNMARFLNEKYIQGENNEYTIFKQRVKAL